MGIGGSQLMNRISAKADAYRRKLDEAAQTAQKQAQLNSLPGGMTMFVYAKIC